MRFSKVPNDKQLPSCKKSDQNVKKKRKENSKFNIVVITTLKIANTIELKMQTYIKL